MSGFFHSFFLAQIGIKSLRTISGSVRIHKKWNPQNGADQKNTKRSSLLPKVEVQREVAQDPSTAILRIKSAQLWEGRHIGRNPIGGLAFSHPPVGALFPSCVPNGIIMPTGTQRYNIFLKNLSRP